MKKQEQEKLNETESKKEKTEARDTHKSFWDNVMNAGFEM